MTSTDVATLADDQEITEPGFYRCSLDRHHSQPCDGVSVTSSVLRTIEIETPADVWWFHMLNPDRYPPKEAVKFSEGRAMHSWVEGGEAVLRRDFIILPPDTPSRPTEAQWNAAKPSPPSVKAMEFWTKIRARQESTGRDILTDTQFKKIRDMGEALARDETATAVIGGEPEITMAWRDEETELWALSRLDNMTFDGLLSDYKKVSAMGRPFNSRLVHRRITDYGYFMQLALGAEGYHVLTGNWPTDCALVFQMDQPPHHCITAPIGQDELYWGMCANHQAMRTFRDCMASGYWPGPGDDLTTYSFSDWQRERFEERQRTGDIPNLPVPGRGG